MEILPARSREPLGQAFVRWGLRGGVLAALGPAVFALATNVSGAATLATLGVSGFCGAAALTVGALVFNRRRISLVLVESDLERARSMMEKRLISEGEYLSLKTRILEAYEAGHSSLPNLWVSAYWGAVLGMLGGAGIVITSLDMVIQVGLISAIAGVVGGSVIGAVAQAATMAGAMPHQGLPAPQNHRLIGE